MKCWLLCLLLTACVADPATPAPQAAYKSGFTAAEQSALVAAIKAEPALTAGIPTDAAAWRLTAKADRVQFWVALFSAIAKYESDFNPNESYTEKFADNSGRRQVSAGLLQLSLDDAANNGCAFKVMADVYDPAKNLQCGVKIAAKLLKRDQLVYGHAKGGWQGLARYWGTMRDAAKLQGMRAAVKAAL